MRVITWNINGLRSINLEEFLQSKLKEVDILCLQETKISRDKLDTQLALIEGYNSYFSCPKTKQGYSGVATFVRNGFEPISAVEGLLTPFTEERNEWPNAEDFAHSFCQELELSTSYLKSLDSEGRAVLTLHQCILPQESDISFLVVVNVYCPRSEPDNVERMSFKLDFFRVLTVRVNRLVNSGYSVLICGDLNVTHRRIDHCDPEPEPEFSKNQSRALLNALLASGLNSTGCCKFVDLFRKLNSNQPEAYTCWNTKLSCRETNFGTRIDYILANEALAENFCESCEIWAEVYGSDHCPVCAMLPLKPIPSKKLPKLCSKFLPELRGNQCKISAFCSTKSEHLEREISRKRKVVSTTMDQFLQIQTKTGHQSESEKKYKKFEVSSNSQMELHNDWKRIFKGPPKPPKCSGHGEVCVLRTVKKSGPNVGKQFYVCAKPEGKRGDPNVRCNFFQWLNKK